MAHYPFSSVFTQILQQARLALDAAGGDGDDAHERLQSLSASLLGEEALRACAQHAEAAQAGGGGLGQGVLEYLHDFVACEAVPLPGPYSPKPFASRSVRARTLNAAGQSRVTLSPR